MTRPRRHDLATGWIGAKILCVGSLRKFRDLWHRRDTTGFNDLIDGRFVVTSGERRHARLDVKKELSLPRAEEGLLNGLL
jgi:hypothetical protein